MAFVQSRAQPRLPGVLDVVLGLALARQPQVSSLGSHILSPATWSGPWR